MMKLIQAIIGASTMAYIGAHLTNEIVPMMNEAMNAFANIPLG